MTVTAIQYDRMTDCRKLCLLAGTTQVVTCVRQPSQGPSFGIKGGAAGGGYSQVRLRLSGGGSARRGSECLLPEVRSVSNL